MANKLIHELPLATSAASADEIEIQKSGEVSTKRIAISALQRLRSTPATEGVTGYLYTSPSTGQTWQLPSFDELQDLPETNAYLYLWLKRIEALELRTFHGNELLSGNVYWVSGLTYHVTDLIYYIDGYLYYADAIDVTLTTSDATHPRIEVIYADVNSDIGVLPGTPSTPPIKPLVDEVTQIELTFATVLALATTPNPLPTNELVFDENVGMAAEWDTSSSGTGTVDFNNADAPYSNTKCVKVSGAIAGTFLNFIKTASTTTLTLDSKLLFRIRSNKAWLNSSGLVIFLLNGGVHFGTNLVIHDGTGGQGHSRNFNYDSTNAAWQTLVVPFSLFNLSTFTLNEIWFETVGNFTSGTEISLDLIQIQEGVTISIPLQYVLPIATASILGGIKVGDNLTIDPVTGVLDATAGASTWIDLTDTTDANYIGKAGYVPSVDVGETTQSMTETVEATFDLLSDTPANKTGSSLKLVRVNVGETALEFVAPAALGAVTGVTDGILDLDITANTLTASAYTAKKGADPGYAYLFDLAMGNGVPYPTFMTRILAVDAEFRASRLRIGTDDSNHVTIDTVSIYNFMGGVGGFKLIVNAGGHIVLSAYTGSPFFTMPVYIGGKDVAGSNDEWIKVDDFNQLFEVNVTDIKFSKYGTGTHSGTPAKALQVDSSGNVIESNPIINNIHATFKSPTSSSGIFHCFGFYEAPAADANLTQASTTQTLGSANNAYQSHAFLVSAAAGTVSGGTTGTAKITISGTSISSAGVRTAGDSEIIVADITALGVNTYIESTKMWLGQITYTLALTGDRTTCAVDFNYGFASANHFFEKNVTIQQAEFTGRAGATDTGFNIQLLKHSKTGWTYSAGAFIPGGTVLLDMNTDFNTEKNLTSGKRFHYHRKGLSIAINGATAPTLTDPNEGIVVRITTGANAAVDTMDIRVQYI